MREESFRWNPRCPPADSDDWCEVQELERDVLLLYHQLLEYDYVMGDLYYGNVFALPYWSYLNPGGLEPDRAVFLQHGCLVMLLAMAWDQIDGSGAYLEKFGREVLAALDSCSPLGEQGERLLSCVKLAVNLALSSEPNAPPELLAESAWVHKGVIRTYFAQKAGHRGSSPAAQQGTAADAQERRAGVVPWPGKPAARRNLAILVGRS